MARLRCAALALLAVGVSAGAPAPAALVMASGGKPGSLVIANHGASQVTIARRIAVEWRDGAKWMTAQTEFNAVTSCPWRHRGANPPPAPPTSVSIPAGGGLRVAPWLGYTCLGQCETACAANVYLGPGAFRFVATVLPSGARVTSPTFTLPPERPGEMMRRILGSDRSQNGR